MARIIYIEFDETRHEVDIPEGHTVMQGGVDNMVDGIIAECGGNCNCATCHVYVDAAWADKLPSASKEEQEMLEGAAGPKENSRLSCQIKVTEELDGLVINIPEFQF